MMAPRESKNKIKISRTDTEKSEGDKRIGKTVGSEQS
jgi:hypothetical protein